MRRLLSLNCCVWGNYVLNIEHAVATFVWEVWPHWNFLTLLFYVNSPCCRAPQKKYTMHSLPSLTCSVALASPRSLAREPSPKRDRTGPAPLH